MDADIMPVPSTSVTELRYTSNNLLDDLKSKQQHLTENLVNLISGQVSGQISSQSNATNIEPNRINKKKNFHVVFNQDCINKEPVNKSGQKLYERFAKSRIINDNPLDEKEKIHKRYGGYSKGIKDVKNANVEVQPNNFFPLPPKLPVVKHVENSKQLCIYNQKFLTSTGDKLTSCQHTLKQKENILAMNSQKNVVAGGPSYMPSKCSHCRNFSSAEINYIDAASSRETVSSFSPPLTWSSVSEGSSDGSWNSHPDLTEKDIDNLNNKTTDKHQKFVPHGSSKQEPVQCERRVKSAERTESLHVLNDGESLWSYYKNSQKPVLGYDWIVNLLNSSDRSVLHRPSDFFEQLQEFRDCNLRDCIGFGTKKYKQDILKEERGKPSISKPCVHKYKINSRLFPEPCFVDENGLSTCTVCKLTKTDTSWRPACTLKIGVPQQHLASSQEINKIRRPPNPNSLSLYQNCHPYPGYKGKAVPCMRLH